MRKWTKAAVIGAALAAGCADEYGDDGYGRGYYDNTYVDHGRYYDNGRYYRDGRRQDWDDRSRRVRVCDDNGDDCHWEYRRR